MNNFFKNLFVTSRYHTRRSKGVFHFCVVVALLLSKSQQQHQNIRFQSKKKLRYEIITVTKKKFIHKKNIRCRLLFISQRTTMECATLNLNPTIEIEVFVVETETQGFKDMKNPKFVPCRDTSRLHHHHKHYHTHPAINYYAMPTAFSLFFLE